MSTSLEKEQIQQIGAIGRIKTGLNDFDQAILEFVHIHSLAVATCFSFSGHHTVHLNFMLY
jgi:hypothetical protein